MKTKKHIIQIASEDLLDITLFIEERNVNKFSLNYRSLIKDKWYQIYRVDNYHGFLHEQRFWRTKIPIPLKENEEIKYLINKYKNRILQNYYKYKTYFINSRCDKNERNFTKTKTRIN